MKISTSRNIQTLRGFCYLEPKHGQASIYITYSILIVSVSSFSHSYRSITHIPHFVAIPKSTLISRRALARTAPGSFDLDWAPNVGAERGSIPPYTSLRRFPACVVSKDLRRRRDLQRSLYVRDIRFMSFACVACGLRCPKRTGAAVPLCTSLLFLLPPLQSTL